MTDIEERLNLDDKWENLVIFEADVVLPENTETEVKVIVDPKGQNSGKSSTKRWKKKVIKHNVI